MRTKDYSTISALALVDRMDQNFSCVPSLVFVPERFPVFSDLQRGRYASALVQLADVSPLFGLVSTATHLMQIVGWNPL